MIGGPISRDGNTRRIDGTCSRDGQFSTSNVRLGSVKSSSRMKCDDFSSEKIIARSKIGGDGKRHSSVVVIESVRRSISDCRPISTSGLSNLSRLIDLEPTVACGKSSSGIILGHESHERSFVTSCDPLIISRSFITISSTVKVRYSHRRSSSDRTLGGSRISCKRHKTAGVISTGNSPSPLTSGSFLHDGI